jgi:hypothetical protein
MAKRPQAGRTGTCAALASTLCPLPHLNQPLPDPEFSNDFWPEGLKPAKQYAVCAVPNSEPDNLWAAGLSHVANSKVLVFGHDAPAAGKRKSPNLTIVGIPRTNLAAGCRFFAERPQEPCQRWWQLGIDEEPHAVRLSDEDGMVEILGGVLEAGADIFSFQVRVVSKNLIL